MSTESHAAAQPANAIAAALAGRYHIERELGSGGMATVYLADDLKHRRAVAIKVLKPEVAASIGPERFLAEIGIAARLNHPHILPLYDSGATGDILYYVMPHVRGETLRQRLTREHQLSIDQARRITRQVASALDFAHAQGVVHRDIKPENVLFHEGEAMLADFGIALDLQDPNGTRLTAAGSFVGTADYMSPEQLESDLALDARSDIYSLGCVTFEMLAGAPPHSAPTAVAVIARRLRGPAPSVATRRSDAPHAVVAAVARALAIERGDRFDSAGAFAAALREPQTIARPLPAVAVLPFRNLSAYPENEYFTDGITEDVIAQLSKIRALKVVSRTSVMPFRTRTQSLRDIGSALDVATILDGSVRRTGDRVRIVAQLVDVGTDQPLWTETYDRQLTDIFVIQTDVALHIAAALRAELSGDERSRINKEPTQDLEAYQLYLHGRYSLVRFTEESMRKSIGYFERAIARDPVYAQAYAGLAQAYAELAETGALEPGEAFRHGTAAVQKALDLDPLFGDAHCVLAWFKLVGQFDWTGAEQELKRALELTPASADAYDLYGRLCAALERYDEAIAFHTRAHELDPFVHRLDLATTFLRAGSYDEALHIATRVVEFDPRDARAHATIGWALLKQSRADEGLSHLKTAVSLVPGETAWLAQLGQAYAMSGRIDDAQAVVRELDTLSERKYVSPYHMAYIYTGLGEYDRAIDYLERAYAARSAAVYGVKGSFLFAPLHHHPRFIALLNRMNLG